MHRSGAAGCLLAAALALTAPAAATAKPAVDQAIATKAKPKVKLRSVELALEDGGARRARASRCRAG